MTSLLDEADIPIPHLDWGTNICIFYQSNVDLLRTAISYLKPGLDNNECCIWAVSPPVTESEVLKTLSAGLPDYERHIHAGHLTITSDNPWSIGKNEFNLQRITEGWGAGLGAALDAGYSGLRIGGNASWLQTHRWTEFVQYEQELGRVVAGRNMIVLCAQALSGSNTERDLDPVARANQYLMTRRNGQWEFLDMDLMERPVSYASASSPAAGLFAGFLNDLETPLTQREKAVLGLILRGFSSKKGGQMLGISPRTIEFHRSNIMQKLHVRNVAELINAVMRNRETLATLDVDPVRAAIDNLGAAAELKGTRAR